MSITAIYQNGYLVRTEPPLEDYYNQREEFTRARHIISDGVQYDLEDESSIASIAVPDFGAPVSSKAPGEYTLGVAGCLDYVLRRKAVDFRKNRKNALSIVLEKKAVQLMQHSKIAWKKSDYKRLIDWLYEDGMISDALYYEKAMSTTSDSSTADSMHERQIQHVIDLGYDLTVAGSFGCCCSECAKRRNRIYSISGTDRRFPKYEEYHCSCQGISFHAFIEGITPLYFPDNDYIAYSNRPFIDDRTEAELNERQYYIDRLLSDSILERDKKNYAILRAAALGIGIKSLRAYRNKVRQHDLSELEPLALEYGLMLYLSEEETAALERYDLEKKRRGQ